MRYADVLLMYAEAANENHDGPTTEAKDALKQVRKRAFAEKDHAEKVEAYVDALGTKEDFFNAIVQELPGNLAEKSIGVTIWHVGICMEKHYIICISIGLNWVK